MHPKTNGPSRRLGIAFVGCGEIALRNAQAVADAGVAEIRWAIDTSEDLARDFAGRWGGRVASGIASALDDPHVDSIFICTPHHLHAPLCLQAVAAGKHVLVEKPIARDAPEAATMIEGARAAGVVLSTCYPMRYLPEVLAAKGLVREGAVGRIHGAKIAEHIYREISYWFGGSSGRSRSSWRTRRETSGGGVLLMNLCHHLDALLFITGLRPDRIYCESDRFAAPGDVEDLVEPPSPRGGARGEARLRSRLCRCRPRRRRESGSSRGIAGRATSHRCRLSFGGTAGALEYSHRTRMAGRCGPESLRSRVPGMS